MMTDWVVEGALGRGGMGEVLAVRHGRWGYPAALKRVRVQPGADAHVHEGFDAEIRAVARLAHPHVVRVLDRGSAADGERWFVMERAAGTLGPPDGWAALARALDELLQGLGAAHGAGILHLDIKPSNVLVRGDGAHALADFGVALLLDQDIGQVRYGSLPYMAPERFEGRCERLSAAADLYAVGCLAWELASGRTPFGGTTWEEAARAHTRAPLPALLPRIPVPAGLEAWARALLAREPGDRFGTAADARAALAQLAAEPLRVGRGSAGSSARPVATAPLTATVAGVPTPVQPTDGRAMAPRPAPLPARWPDPPVRRREGVGLGLLGLLGLPFVGREAEREALWAALGRADAGAFAAVVLAGPSGVGRTRLGQAFAEAAVAHGGAHLLAVPAGPDPVGAALRRALRVQGDGASARALVAARAGVAPDDPRVARALGDAATDRAHALIELLAQGRRTVLWIDDVDAHPDAWALAKQVIGQGPPGVLLVVGRVDPSATPAPWLNGVDRLDLQPLSKADTRRLLADWVGLRPALVADLAERCEGDVGLAVAMVLAGVQAGQLTYTPDGLAGAEDQVLPWPERASARWRDQARGVLDALDPAARTAALRAAALGPPVDLDTWERACADAAACARALDALIAGGLIAQARRWVSPMARHALLAFAEDPRAHHLACAEALPGPELAWRRGQHRLAAGQLTEAFADLFASAANVITSGQMARAARILDEVERTLVGHGVPTRDPAWGELWSTRSLLGPTHQGYRRCWELTLAAVEGARANPGVPAWEAVEVQAVGHLVWLANVQFLPRQARPWLDRLRELNAVAHRRLGTFHDNQGWYLLTVGASRAAELAFARSVAWGQARGYTRLPITVAASRAVALRHQGDPSAVDELQRCFHRILQAGIVSARGDAASAVADGLRFAGRLDEALPWYEEALRAEAEGEARADPGFRMGLGLLHRAAGRTELAEQELRWCRARLTDHGPSWAGGLALHHATVGGQVDLAGALDALESTGWVDPDLELSARLLCAGVHPPALQARIEAFADAQRRALERGRSADAGEPEDPLDTFDPLGSDGPQAPPP